MASVAAAALVALSFFTPALGARQHEGVTISVPGRSSQTPWAAAAGDFVVVAFGGQTAAGKADVFVAVSRDGGRRFATPVRVNTAEGDARLGGELPPRVGLVGRTGLEPEIVVALYYARDGAASAGERELVKGVCYCCKVAMAATPSGGIYAAWRHVYAGNIRDVAFIAAFDGGRHFGTPARVSVDDWHLAGCPDDGPAMSVDERGTAHVVWPTVLGGPTPEGALFYASSADGQSFSPRTRIPTLGSPRPMHPQVMAQSGDRVLVAWDEVVDGVRQAAVRSMRFDEAGQPIFGAPRRLGSPEVPTSYPILVAPSRGTLAVYVEGKPGASVIRVARVLGA